LLVTVGHGTCGYVLRDVRLSQDLNIRYYQAVPFNDRQDFRSGRHVTARKDVFHNPGARMGRLTGLALLISASD
jgi:hypothetical protein